MSEDYTYDPVTPLREQLATVVRLQERVRKLERENAELRKRLEGVPLDAVGAVMEVADVPFGYLAERRSIHNWLDAMGWKP